MSCQPVSVVFDTIFIRKKKTKLQGAGDAAGEIVRLFSNKHDE